MVLSQKWPRDHRDALYIWMIWKILGVPGGVFQSIVPLNSEPGTELEAVIGRALCNEVTQVNDVTMRFGEM